MADTKLDRFVQDALRAGAPRKDIERVLGQAGWSTEQVSSALGAYSTVEFAIPVPQPKSQLSARDAFLYLVMFGMLYVSLYNLGNLIIQLINLAFPDPLTDFMPGIRAAIRWSTSAVVVTFPVFLFVAFRISRDLARDPSRRTSAVRKWLTYLTLSIAACIVAGDLVVLLNSLLAGELTTRFVLKALTVGALAGAAFVYYLWSMRADDEALAE